MDNKDPENQGRIKVKVPMVGGNEILGPWAWPKVPWAGKNSGSFWIPDVYDPVVVTFRNGNPKYPRYGGGWWPKVKGGTDYSMQDAYVDGVPTKRIFRTKAGHELSFDDDSTNLTCKLIWCDKADPENPKYTFISFTKEGSIQGGNHKGSFFELRAKEDEVLNTFADANGNRIIQDDKGTKVADKNGNLIEMKNGVVQVTCTDGVVISSKSVALETGGVTVGPSGSAVEDTVKGTSFMNWWNLTFLTWLTTHVHPTGVGPSGPPAVPPTSPPAVLLTKKLKVQ